MEKISGILPSSPRLASADMRESAPVRPGTPSFGRPMGVSALKGDPVISSVTAPKSSAIQKEMMDWRSKDMRQAQIAAELSDKFFINNRTEAAPTVEDLEPITASGAMFQPSVKSNPAGFKMDEFGFLRGPANTPMETFEEEIELEVESKQPEGLYPKGSFLDRTA